MDVCQAGQPLWIKEKVECDDLPFYSQSNKSDKRKLGKQGKTLVRRTMNLVTTDLLFAKVMLTDTPVLTFLPDNANGLSHRSIPAEIARSLKALSSIFQQEGKDLWHIWLAQTDHMTNVERPCARESEFGLSHSLSHGLSPRTLWQWEAEVRSANQIAGNKVRVRGRVRGWIRTLKITKFLTFDSNSTSDWFNQMC